MLGSIYLRSSTHVRSSRCLYLFDYTVARFVHVSVTTTILRGPVKTNIFLMRFFHCHNEGNQSCHLLELDIPCTFAGKSANLY